ncbi:hypothetical protein [Pikeienuella sp. HZG-20]|uniref:hypothetical protein n=1 Tax=Paludibacillus litoralis TaxID=3133267 RepID=UPI0030EB1861
MTDARLSLAMQAEAMALRASDGQVGAGQLLELVKRWLIVDGATRARLEPHLATVLRLQFIAPRDAAAELRRMVDILVPPRGAAFAPGDWRLRADLNG